jgi:hypothetical protein
MAKSRVSFPKLGYVEQQGQQARFMRKIKKMIQEQAEKEALENAEKELSKNEEIS